MRRRRLLAAFGALMAVGPPRWAAAAPGNMRGRISWYGQHFAGRMTASGEPYDPEALTMAHRTLPFGTRVRVTHRRRSVVLRVNDRGPWRRDRVADVSRAAARRLGILRAGLAHATLEVLLPPQPGDAAVGGGLQDPRR